MKNGAGVAMLFPLIVVSVIALTFAVGTLPSAPQSQRIAYVNPVFTITPYYRSWVNGNGSFYSFYAFAQDFYHPQRMPSGDHTHLPMAFDQSSSTQQTALGPQASDAPGDANVGGVPKFITKNLNWLSTQVVSDEWTDLAGPNLNTTFSLSLLNALRQNFVVQVIDDLDVNSGGLFNPNGTRKFDVVVLGHEEYVTDVEYSQFEMFVATGGRLVATDGNTFYARVNYSASTNTETYVVGHDYEFNGSAVWESSTRPYDNRSTNWFGSVFVQDHSRIFAITHAQLSGGGRIFTGYRLGAWEVNMVTNFTQTNVLAKFHGLEALVPGVDITHSAAAELTPPIDMYCHRYRAGVSCSFGVFGEYLLFKGDREAERYLTLMVRGDHTDPPP